MEWDNSNEEEPASQLRDHFNLTHGTAAETIGRRDTPRHQPDRQFQLPVCVCVCVGRFTCLLSLQGCDEQKPSLCKRRTYRLRMHGMCGEYQARDECELSLEPGDTEADSRK